MQGGSVAAWLSEKVLRGRGPDASGFESHRRGRIFSKEGTSAGPWMCVYVSSGLTVGWWKEEKYMDHFVLLNVATFKNNLCFYPNNLQIFLLCPWK
jgi:hypothetical protein